MANLTNEEVRQRLLELGYDVPISINREFYLKFLAQKEEELGLQTTSSLINTSISPGAGGDFHQEGMKEPEVVDAVNVPEGKEDSKVVDLDSVPVQKKTHTCSVSPVRVSEASKATQINAKPPPGLCSLLTGSGLGDSALAEKVDATAGEITDMGDEKTMKDQEPFTLYKKLLPRYLSALFLLLVPLAIWIWRELLDPIIQQKGVHFRRMILNSVVAVVLTLMAWKGYVVYKRFMTKQQEELLSVVEKVRDLLREQYAASLESESVPPYLAIDHIRDDLLPQEQNAAITGLWSGVVDQVSKREPRVLEEIKDIDGVDVKTWRWLPSCTH